jgi:hypothetical protein
MSPAGDDSSGEDAVDFTLDYAKPSIVSYLDDRDDPVDNLTLVSIAVREQECDRRDLEPPELPLPEVHDRVLTEHLPALSRDGLVDYDRTDETVTLTASREAIERSGG